MNIRLSDHFDYKRLLRFVLPSVVMMVFTSLYVVVDGLFVSNFVGKTAFAAVNLIYPVLQMLGALGFMVGTGGSAIVSKTLGEGEPQKAKSYFSLLVYLTLLVGSIIAAVGIIYMRQISMAIGAADAEMIEDCTIYGRLVLAALPFFMLQNVFQSFFVAAEKPQLGLAVTVGAGLTNVVFDYLLIVVFGQELVGAALATALSQFVGGIVPLFYFAARNSSLLRLGKTQMNGRVLLKTCTNGFSELMTNISLSVVNILYNFELLAIAQEDGVAAYGVIMYVNFIFISVFLGYAIGVAPVISFHYGAQNRAELHSLFRKSLVIVSAGGVAMVAIAELLSAPLSHIFVGYDAGLYEMTRRGFSLFALSFFFVGVNIFASSFFTALNNGTVSAAISFLRTLVLQIAAVMLLPLVLGLDGIWLAVVAAELAALGVCVFFFLYERRRYGYA